MDPNGNGWNPLSEIDSALTTTANDLKSGVTSAAKEWNNLPAGDKDAIFIGVAVVATVATGGAAAPLILAAGLAGGAGGVGIYAAYTSATGGTITERGVLNSFTVGFTAGTAVGGIASLEGELASSSVESDTAGTWVSPQSLLRHFALHPEMGATPEEMEASANNLLTGGLENQFPMKINPEQYVQYVYNPDTGEFGVYTLPRGLSDLGGKTISYHYASPSYFLKQYGFSPFD